jgi:prephenate dehydrogenase
VKVAIIGGAGKMGQWFARFFLAEGIEVMIADSRYSELRKTDAQLAGKLSTNENAIEGSDAVLIAVPIDNFEEAVKELSPYLCAGQVVVDISSIKAKTVDIMHRYIATGLVLGVHPMFGPGAINISKKNFILTPTTNEENEIARRIEIYLKDKGAHVSLMTPVEHDEIMAIILGLPSFIAIVTADTLLSLDKLQFTRRISGSTYKLLLMLTESVIVEDAKLYASLQVALPHISQVEHLFKSKVGTWSALIKKGDKDKIYNKMRKLECELKKIDPGLSRSYENMCKVVEIL